MRRVFAVFCACLLFNSGTLPAGESEIEISVEKVPAHVLKAARARVKGFEAEEAEVEAMLVYELVGEVDGKEIEIEMTSAGRIFNVELEERDSDENEADDDDQAEEDDGESEDEDEQEFAVKPNALPKRFLQAVRKKFPRIEIKKGSVEAVLVYSIEGEVGENEYTIEVTADGDVIGVEKEED